MTIVSCSFTAEESFMRSQHCSCCSYRSHYSSHFLARSAIAEFISCSRISHILYFCWKISSKSELRATATANLNTGNQQRLNSLTLWHRRFAHLHPTALKKAIKVNKHLWPRTSILMIAHDVTMDKTQHKNDTSERMIRTLNTKARSMLQDANLPARSCGEAIQNEWIDQPNK